MKSMVMKLIVACLAVTIAAADNDCATYDAEYGMVCVCNATYCDTPGTLPTLGDNEYALITTSSSGQRFNVTTGVTIQSPIPYYMYTAVPISIKTFFDFHDNFVYISVYPEITHQEIEGFGGSFTDSVGLNINNVSSEVQEYLLKSFFGSDGLDYNLARTPIGGSDFSLYAYALNEYPENDIKLSNFSLRAEDHNLKIPFIKRAIELATEELRLQGAVWSPPKWMKTNNQLYGHSELKPEYYETYALYHLKFLQEYKKENITFYAVSTGNEPIISALGNVFSINSLGWVVEKQCDWLVNYFGPMIRESEFSDIKIYILDDQVTMIDDMLPIMVAYKGVSDYADGVTVHWYLNPAYPLSVLNKVQYLLPGATLLNNEACSGFLSTDPGMKLGKWDRAEYYLRNVIESINNNINGWIDWNLALNMQGGPKWNAAGKDAFVIVDAENNQFYKQPTFYAFGHLSKYVPRGSVRLESNALHDIPHATFRRPDGLISVVIMNNLTISRSTHIEDKSTGQFLNFTMEPNSISTVVYKPTQLCDFSN